MNILIIGNGFDLAHKLPTKYKDFLNFVRNIQNRNFNIKILYNEYNINSFIPDQTLIELYQLINNNTWLSYFKNVFISENWIDFEMEISNIIQLLDSLKIQKEFDSFFEENIKIEEWQINKLDSLYIFDDNKITIKQYNQFKKLLLNDLDRLTRALEIYLSYIVNHLEISNRILAIEKLNIDKVLSFNYTNTYERIYGNNNTEYDYIHGKAEIGSTIDDCNLVLGIDEYLDDTKKNENNEFIQFKKFYQRIYKMTGCLYLKWIKEIDNKNTMSTMKKNLNIYIYGHSLNITDKDILSDLINYKYSQTTIFYHEKESLGNLISNLVKIIGENNLISKVQETSIIFKRVT